MPAPTPEIAVVARIKSGPTAAGGRVYPQVNTQEPTLPFITVTRQGAQPGARLSGSRSPLLAATIEVDHFAATQAAAVALSIQTRALLAPTGDPWRDLANGVQGCFLQDSTEEIISDDAQDTPRLIRDTYLVWHFPT